MKELTPIRRWPRFVGIIGLALSASKKHDLVTNGAKDDLSKFVVKEMERVRKQHGLKKNDVYKDKLIEIS
jgi:hypothetical protein